jgi:hypothetical protein
LIFLYGNTLSYEKAILPPITRCFFAAPPRPAAEGKSRHRVSQREKHHDRQLGHVPAQLALMIAGQEQF